MERTMGTRVAMGVAALVLALAGGAAALGLGSHTDGAIRPVHRQVTPDMVDRFIQEHSIPT